MQLHEKGFEAYRVGGRGLPNGTPHPASLPGHKVSPPDVNQPDKIIPLADVLRRAQTAGTASDDVRLTWDDRLATAADGTELFLERRIRADLAGRPDVATDG